MFTYSPPANIDDLAGRPTRAAFLDDWHAFIKAAFDAEIKGLEKVRPPVNPQFASEVAGAFPGEVIPVTWNAFPLKISRAHPHDTVGAWTAANVPSGAQFGTTRVSVRPQDEYCEWFEYREAGKLTKIVFTAEGPEYWVLLAKHDIAYVVDRYQHLVSPDVVKEDLLLTSDLQWFDKRVLAAGSYNPYNKWNTSQGVMHLTEPANTLGAEIDLAARATLVRHDASGNRITDVRQFACCSDFGDPNRSSDPNIGSAVNISCVSVDGVTIQDVTLADPVALYIRGLQQGTLTGPGNVPVDDWFTVVRGVDGRGLMAVLEPPAGAAFGLDQVSVKGVPLTLGGQVADVIQMVLYAKVRPHAAGGAVPPTYSCLNQCCAPVGTDQTAYRNINFSSPDDAGDCSAGSATAYSDAAPAQVARNFDAEIGHAVHAEVGFPTKSKRVAYVLTSD